MNVKLILLILLLNLSIVFPSSTLDSDVEYIRLYSHYHWMTFKIFNSLYFWCNARNLSIDEIAGLINSESNGNPKALSIAGAKGLLQVMDFHFAEDPQQLFSIDKNIEIGTSYYSWCKKHCNGNMKCVLMTYNAGPHNKEYKNWMYVYTIWKNSSQTKKNKNSFYELR